MGRLFTAIAPHEKSKIQRMIRILLVDDQTIICQALKALLDRQQDFQVVGIAADGYTAIEQVAALRPDVVLIDIQMPGLDGVAATRLISQRFRGVKVLVLSGHDDGAYLKAALSAGAQGYLLKDTGAEDLATAIRSAYRGYGQMSPGLFEKMMSSRQEEEDVAIPSPAPELAQSVLSETELLLLLQSFDPSALSRVVERTTAQGATPELLNTLSHHLRSAPTNLATLYLSGALAGNWAAQDPEQQTSAMQYLRFGFKEGIRQGLPAEHLLLFYREGAKLEAEESFNWLSQAGSPWNNEAGMVFLSQEAAHTFGQDSVQYRTLLALRQIRSLKVLSETCRSLTPKLHVLRQGLTKLEPLVPAIAHLGGRTPQNGRR
ncbi:MAG: response regulator transcription factor [Leptolyngbyaceae cyanobacterium SM1_4_3]|nr:response regulator transcription factor [Leptolyngbyaceae cyanobacterium SM1_4_3]